MNRSPRANVRRLAAGRLISVVGGAAAYTSLMFTIWDRTHSPVWQSLALLATFGVTGVIGPFTGALGDRFDRRSVMIASEALSAALFAVMAFVHDPGLLLALGFASAVSDTAFFSASRAAIPNLVGEEDLSWANSLISVGVNAGITLGPVIGGVTVSIVGPSSGPSWVFGINAVTFLVSLLLTVSVRASFSDRRASEESEEHRGLSAGLRFLLREPVLVRINAAWLVFLLGLGMGMVADVPLAEEFDAGSTGFGLIIASWGLGSVVGSLAGRRLTPRTEPLALVIGAAVIATTSLGIGVAPVFWPILALVVAMGTADGIALVAEQGIMQRRTPDAVRSRLMAAYDAMLSIGLVVAYAFAGPVLELVGAQGVYAVGGVFGLAAVLVLLPLLRLRDAAPIERSLEEAIASEAEPSRQVPSVID